MLQTVCATARSKSSLVSIFILLICSYSVAQKPLTAGSDSLRLYKSIEKYSKESKFKTFIYRLVFKQIDAPTSKKQREKKVDAELKTKSYNAFEGKIIRNIKVQSFYPFGYTITDTAYVKQTLFPRIGNQLHVKSRGLAIRNLLLIRQNQRFDSLLVKESERLVRSKVYVRDVAFITSSSVNSSDSVDIIIRVLDKWSILPKVVVTTSRVGFSLSDNNFLGLGHVAHAGVIRNHTIGHYDFNSSYLIPNFRSTYIATTFKYKITELDRLTSGIAIERPFFSPLARWAAGLNYYKQIWDETVLSNLQYQSVSIEAIVQDVWAGNALKISNDKSEYHRTTNFVSSFRYRKVQYFNKPQVIDGLYPTENLYMVCFGVSARQYIQEKYLLKFGTKEDVPVGKVYSITAGIQRKGNINMLYLGSRVSLGSFYSWGYLSTTGEFGIFVNKDKSEQGSLLLSINYFTRLFEIGNLRLRQFVKPQVLIGINRNATDSLTLNEGEGLDGFNSLILSGTKRLMLTLQTQIYTPWNILGFRFGPYISLSCGMLGNDSSGFNKSKLYSKFGVGILIKNNHLVINTFQVSISFYPSIPGIGDDVVKMNSFKTTDFDISDFDIGKPAVVTYR